MRGWSTSGMIHALTKCHNVDSFTIIIGEFFGTGTASRPRLIQARSLDIGGTFSGDQYQGIELLNSLIATQLKSLTLRKLGGIRWKLSLLDFISRSQCPLRTLTLHDIPIDQHLLQLLSLVPTLISLTMEIYSNIDDTLLNGLVATPELSISPRLQQFDLVCHYRQTENRHLDNTVPRILAMAESRLRPSSSVESLERFSVKYEVLASSGWDLNSESLLRLQRLNETGMKASIKVVDSFHKLRYR
ncbi:hypothetical protein BDP27DRAFT_256060 [Rhodocollybia butyracea]|uniref:Uncharacterized protein n=1 Tax=Rhodocollybia butyracea TaxID=206335 RepID=A0A9P5PI05_9AGAR|nr:hypothetical protein BDP27DRAFT_256060 [Rhodocollybia butyracea]